MVWKGKQSIHHWISLLTYVTCDNNIWKVLSMDNTIMSSSWKLTAPTIWRQTVNDGKCLWVLTCQKHWARVRHYETPIQVFVKCIQVIKQTLLLKGTCEMLHMKAQAHITKGVQQLPLNSETFGTATSLGLPELILKSSKSFTL
jgi:hypothetical protein